MLKLVEYDKWCQTCQHFKECETGDPCNDCLNEPVNDDSRKPVYYKPAEEEKNQNRKKRGDNLK